MLASSVFGPYGTGCNCGREGFGLAKEQLGCFHVRCRISLMICVFILDTDTLDKTSTIVAHEVRINSIHYTNPIGL